MTIGEWGDKGFIMDWSIYGQRSEDEYYEWLSENEARRRDDPENFSEEERSRYLEIELDLRAPEECPDGIFAILHNGITEGRSGGVVVREGQFIPDNIAQAAAESVCASYGTTKNDVITGRTGIDHVYIEKFTWIASLGILEVHTRS